MKSLAYLNSMLSEAWCKRYTQRLTTGDEVCQGCQGRIIFRRSVSYYGWRKGCRCKILPNASTWFRGSKLSYQQTYQFLRCWQSRLSPGATQATTGLSYTAINRWHTRFREHLPPESAAARRYCGSR